MRSRPSASLLAAAALLLAGCASAPLAEPAEISVLVYNIHAGKDAGGTHNLERVAELVRETGADVVMLQEVDRETTRSGREDQLATLTGLLGFHGAFGHTLDYQGGGYGIAVLSRWPIVADTLHPLPVDPPQERAGGSREPRGAHWVRIDLPGPDLYVLNTHIDASRDDRFRLQEIASVLEIGGRTAARGEMVLLGGDLNSTPESAVIARVAEAGWRDAFEACGTGEGLTFPAAAPVRRIDYLFMGPGIDCIRARVPDSQASDHRALLVRVRRGER